MEPIPDFLAMDVDESLSGICSLAQEEEAKRSFCPICNCESFSSYELCPHLLATCDIEDDLKAFLKDYSPRGSISGDPPLTSSLQCEFCHTVCKNQKGLRQHIGKMHETKKRTAQCPQCEKRFKHKYAVRFHLKQVHEKTTRAECPHCGKSVYNKYWLQDHIRTAHQC